MRIVLASHNIGKIVEMQALLSDLPIDLIPQQNFNISEVPETGTTFVENALIKARYAAQKSGLPALSDDSGLTIDALQGAPGIYSARYAGKNSNDSTRIAKVLKELKDIPKAQRNAQFHCTIVLVRHANDSSPIVCEGTWSGQILEVSMGNHGFGYDPIFYVPQYQCSAAELDTAIKAQISHRGRAIKALRKILLKELPSLSQK